MDKTVDTLFLAAGDIEEPAVFLGARYHAAITPKMALEQDFRPYTEALEARGLHVSSVLEAGRNRTALLLLPKNMVEARGMVARALAMLGEGGTIVCAAANDAGGKRFKKMLQGFGLQEIDEISKNHARAASAKKINANEKEIAAAITEAGVQEIAGGEFISIPGIFGWDKIDKGSKLLVAQLPEDLQGTGADFGCGYGYLSRHILQKSKGVRELCAIDADARALECCKKNLQQFDQVTYQWTDLTQKCETKNLDWIVMNPPFHEGKDADSSIGRAFIATAAKSLKPGGQLWMVANINLPYENFLKELFSDIEKKFEGEGFKIYKAVK